MARYIKQGLVNTVVLAYFFASAQGASASATEDSVVDALSKHVGERRIRLAVQKLISSQYIEDTNESQDEYIYAITADGYAKAEGFFLKPEPSAVKDILEKGVDQFFVDYLSKNASELDSSSENDPSEVPASDRVVTVSDNMAGFGELISTLDEADERIRASNDLPAEEKNWIRNHFEAGLALLRKGGTILQSALKSLLLEPLETAMKESSEDGLRKVLAAALHAIRTYLGIF
jgi:hypothetical protein